MSESRYFPCAVVTYAKLCGVNRERSFRQAFERF